MITSYRDIEYHSNDHSLNLDRSSYYNTSNFVCVDERVKKLLFLKNIKLESSGFRPGLHTDITFKKIVTIIEVLKIMDKELSFFIVDNGYYLVSEKEFLKIAKEIYGTENKI